MLIALGLTNLIHTREQRRPKAVVDKTDEQPLSGSGGFKLVLSQRYLLLIGLLTLTVQLVNTNGNYILNETLARMARDDHRRGEQRTDAKGRSSAASWPASISGRTCCRWSIQFFLVSRIFKYLGIGGALFVLPVISLGSYGLFAFAPVLAFIRLTKIAENATDYSLQNTVRRALFLPDVARGEVQGAPGGRNVLLARRRHAVRCRRPSCSFSGWRCRFAASRS